MQNTFASVKKIICQVGLLSVGPNCVGLHTTTINQSLFNLNELHSGGSNHSTSFQQVNYDLKINCLNHITLFGQKAHHPFQNSHFYSVISAAGKFVTYTVVVHTFPGR